MSNSENNVYIYWVGKEYSLIKILRNLINIHSTNGKGYNVHFINDKNLHEYIDDIPSNFKDLCPAHQADYVRVNVIYKRGGIWLDSDTIVMESLDSLFDLIKNYDGFFIRENNQTLCNGIFGSKANTEVMKLWKTKIDEIINKKSNIEWNEIGSYILESIPNELFSNYHIFNGLDNIYPINWDKCVDEFLLKPYENYQKIIRNYQPLVVLVNSVYKHLEHLSEKEILKLNLPLNYFINKSFENSKCNFIFNDLIMFHFGNKDYISQSIIQKSCWEPNITNVFYNILKNSNKSIVFDIGCNLGYYSLISSLFSNKVYSFDGNEECINIFKKSISINNINNISINNICISDELCKYKMKNKLEIDNNGNNGGLSFEKTESEVYDSESTTLDFFIHQNNIDDIILMKIDIEGGELNAIKGCLKTLKTSIIKNIIIEISPCFNNDSFEILSIIKDNDYDIYNIPTLEIGNFIYDSNYLSKLNKVLNIENFVNSVNRQTNILAIKNSNVLSELSIQNNKDLINLDFIEIGTSNFNTLIQTCNDKDFGISIDAINYYLNCLPDKINVKKVNVAISNSSGKLDIYYIPEKIIDEKGLPDWLKGCNSINEYHPLHIKHNLTHLCITENVNVITMKELYDLYSIGTVKYLKIDTEGHDCIILKSYYSLLKSLHVRFYPKKILFESNEHTSRKDVEEIIDLYKELNYNMIFSNTDTLLELNQNIVIVSDWLKDYITKEHYEFVLQLENEGWKLIFLSELDINYIQKVKTTILFVTYDDLDISLLNLSNSYVIYKLDDVFPYKEVRQKCINSCNLLIGPYQYLFKDLEYLYPGIKNKNSLWIPYSCIPKIYNEIEFNNNPINKIFISGYVDDRYPLRNYSLSCKNVESLNHPGYNNHTHKIIDLEYNKKLNEYLCCFCDASSYKYVLLKIFEITSVGSLLLVCDSIKNELNLLGFIDNLNCIFCNKDNINDKIEYILNDKNRLIIDEIRMKGIIISREKHSTIERSETLIKSLEISFDNVNSFPLDNNRLLFFDIYHKDNQLILICPVYDKIDPSEFINRIKITNNGNLLQPEGYRAKIEYESTLIIGYKFISSNELNTINVEFNGITKIFTLKQNKDIEQNKLTITTLFKDDFKLIDIFYPYYLNQGVELFYLYYNGILTPEIKQLFLKKGIKLIEWNFKYLSSNSIFIHHAQMGQIHHSLWKYGKNRSDYMIFCDFDEYLTVDNKTLIDEIYDKKYDYFGFCTQWCITSEIPKSLPFNFTKGEIINYPVRSKCIYKVSAINIIGIHYSKDNLNGKSDYIMYHFLNWSNIKRTILPEDKIHYYKLEDLN